MVKLVCFLKRKEGLTLEEFYEHWLGHHGPLIRRPPSWPATWCATSSTAGCPSRPGPARAGYDGITIQWFESVDEFSAFCAEPTYAELIEPDEATFLDRDAFVWMITEEPMVTMDGPTTSRPARTVGPEVGVLGEEWDEP